MKVLNANCNKDDVWMELLDVNLQFIRVACLSTMRGSGRRRNNDNVDIRAMLRNPGDRQSKHF
eukprot:4735771-Karenia_brevis.AAC.1